MFVKIWIDEGPRTLFKGYWATILGVIPYAGTSFYTFETLKRKHYGTDTKCLERSYRFVDLSEFISTVVLFHFQKLPAKRNRNRGYRLFMVH